MTTRKRKKIDPTVLFEQDETLIALKERYFKLITKEKIGRTPQLSATLDKLEQTIKLRKETIVNENT